MHEHFDLIIVGAGPAGLTAAIYARRAGRSVLVLERSSIGGQIASAPKVENYPGFSAISGAELAERLYTQAEDLGARIELETVTSIVPGPAHTITTDYGTYTAAAVILATGTVHRTLGLPGEDILSGISYCAVCDGAFYQGRDVAVCGGGSSALQESLFLSDLCRHVTLIHRRQEFRGDPILLEALQARSNVTILPDTRITALESRNGTLTGLLLEHAASGTQSHLDVDGLFVAVGQQPDTTLSQALGIAGEDGYIPAGEDCHTPIGGIFTAGDCRTKDVRQLTTACADGASAALAACQWCTRQSREV